MIRQAIKIELRDRFSGQIVDEVTLHEGDRKEFRQEISIRFMSRLVERIADACNGGNRLAFDQLEVRWHRQAWETR